MKLVRAGLILIFAASVIGCAKVRVVGYANDPVEHERVGHCWGWNLRGEDETVTIRTKGKLAAVKVSMNYLQSLCTVVTLGLYMPYTISWEEGNEDRR